MSARWATSQARIRRTGAGACAISRTYQTCERRSSRLAVAPQSTALLLEWTSTTPSWLIMRERANVPAMVRYSNFAIPDTDM